MKKEAIKKIIKQVRTKGATEVRVVGETDNSPKKLEYRGSRKSFTPDMVALFPNHRDLFSIENKITKKALPDLISKWILFGLEARKHNGKFYLIVPKEHKTRCKEIIDSKQLSAELMPM